MGRWADELHAKAPKRPIMVSEYGAGASIRHQQDPALRPETTAGFHLEHYQALYHETNWRLLRERPFVWADFVWVGFDFASDGRNEGDRPGINDKGLVTHDRQTRKDAYYWYKSNWTIEPMVYISHRRQVLRTTPTADLKICSNGSRVTLTVNGTKVGTRPVEDHIALWPDLALTPGLNRTVATTGSGSGARSDQVEWIYDPSALPIAPPGQALKVSLETPK